MSRTDIWMPLFISDYLSDTAKLTTIEHGAYLLLLMEYWRHGPLPNNDKELCAIARMDRKLWDKEVGPSIRRFFKVADDGLLHQKRSDKERKRATELSEKRRVAAKQKLPKSPPVACSNEAIAQINGQQTSSNSSAIATDLLPSLSRDNSHSSLRSEKQEDPSLRSGCVEQVLDDPQKALWSEGLATYRCLTKLPPGPARERIGKLLKTAGKDHAALLDLIRKAEIEQPDDAFAWITKALGKRKLPTMVEIQAPDDPWGVNAWTAKQPDVQDGMVSGESRKTINGWSVEHYAERIAEAAGLTPAWRGNWDCLGKWLRDDMGMIDEKPVLEAVRNQASRLNGSISSMAVFDSTVRGAAARCQARH